MHTLRRQTLFLTEPQIGALQREAKRLGIKMPELIRRIIDQWREAHP